MKYIWYVAILAIGLLGGREVCGEVIIQRSNILREISCVKGSIELVLDRAINCMSYSTYQTKLTNDNFNRIQHYCYEGSLKKYQCSGYKLIINQGFLK